MFPFLCSSCNITLIISTVKRWVLIILWRLCERYEPCKMVKKTPCKFTCKDVFFCYFIGRQPYSEGSLSRAVHGVCHYFTGIFHLLSHSIFLVWPHFYDKFLEKYICLIFLPHFTTTAYGLYHSRYGFWQVHFRHLVLHMRLLCNMIVDIHCNLCIWMFFAPLRSVLNGCPPDIQHPITYCITLGLTLFSPSLVHPVWRRVCDEIGGISSGSLSYRGFGTLPNKQFCRAEYGSGYSFPMLAMKVLSLVIYYNGKPLFAKRE